MDTYLSVSVVFATHNGEGTLPRMLERCLAIDVEDLTVNFIAVNNASNDATADILNGFISRLPLTVITESRRGKNIALNAGIAAATGDLIVLTDDDILPKPDWLQQLARAAREEPDCVAFGGHIVPEWPVPPENWILEQIPPGAYGATDRQLSRGADQPMAIFGANMALRRRLFDRGNRFNENIGPAGANYIMGSETEFVKRIAANGGRTYFVPEAEVGHIVREKQMTKAWLMARAFRSGRAIRHFERDSKVDSRLRIIDIPLWRIRRYFVDSIYIAITRMIGESNRTIWRQWRNHQFRGYLYQWFQTRDSR